MSTHAATRDQRKPADRTAIPGSSTRASSDEANGPETHPTNRLGN
jgi:hypothetical protein